MMSKSQTASSKSKYIVRRNARVREPLPGDVIKIPAPKQPPQPLAKPSLLTMLPIIVMALSTGAISFIVNKDSNLGPRAVLTVIPMLMMGFMMMGIQSWIHRSNVKKHEADVAQLKTDYHDKLQTARDRLQELASRQQHILNRESPSLNELVKRVMQRDKTLWERQPNDNDFLALRLGTGALPISATIKIPDGDVGELHLKPAMQLAEEFALVEYLPIMTNVNRLGAVGVRGQKPSQSLYLAYTLVANIVTHHSPDEVHLYVLSHRHDAAERWGWLRWLPHTNALQKGQGGVVRLSFAPGRTDEDILLELAQLLRQRSDEQRRARRLEPHLVVIFDETPTLQGHQVMGLLLSHDPNSDQENKLQASAVFVENPIPPQVNAMITIRGAELDYRETWAPDASQTHHGGTAELARPKQIEQLARSMAPLRTEASYNATGGSLPSSVRLVELLGATQPEQLDLSHLYSETYDPKKVMAFPVGFNVDLKPQMVILRETGQDGHGSHAMLAGMTGTGKSVLLQSIVLSLALTNSPAHLNFVLADFKGGASELAKLQGLPHLVGFVTDLNRAMVERFRIALESEIRRRKELLDAAKAKLGQPVANIRDYNKLCPDEPLPHLVVLLDEFAHGLNINPDFRGAMDTIAAQGRAFGVHLILSTQRAADFDNKIRPNIDIRMSLRVASRDDSKIMFNRVEAYTRLQRPGQAYIQVGDNEIFEMFQAARADVPYQPEGTVNLDLVDNFAIHRIKPDGRRDKKPLYEHKVVEKGDEREQAGVTTVSEAEVLVEHIRRFCEGKYLTTRQICLPPLLPAGGLPLPQLLADYPAYNRWLETGWTKETGSALNRLRLPIGMLDLPARQDQQPYILDFNQGDGNFLVVGPAGAGKTLFLRSLILGLALTHTPADVNLYILSRGASLTFLEALPHCHGNVIRPMESERQARLFAFLQAEAERRRALMREARVDTVAALRLARPDLPLPSLFLVIEDYAGFRADHETTQPDRLDRVLTLAREGKAVDLRLIVSSNDARSVQKLRDTVQNRLALGMKSAMDYMEVLDKRAEVLGNVEGRGYVIIEQSPVECQIAAPTPEPLRSGQEMTWLKMMVAVMKANWDGYRPLSLIELPVYVELTWLWQAANTKPDPESFVLALRETWGSENNVMTAADLPEPASLCRPAEAGQGWFRRCTAPVAIDYYLQEPAPLDLTQWGTYNVIVGPAKSGKTDLLLSLCLAAARNLRPSQVELFIFDLKTPHSLRPLAALPQVRYANTSQQAKRHLQELLNDIQERHEAYQMGQEQRDSDVTQTGPLFIDSSKQSIILVDDLLLFMQKGDGELFKLLDDCIRQGQEIGLKIVLADTSQNINQARQLQQVSITVESQTGGQSRLMSQSYLVKFVQSAYQYGRGVAFAAEPNDAAPLNPQARLKLSVSQLQRLKVGKGRGFMLQQDEASLVQFARFGLPDEDEKARRARLKQLVKVMAADGEVETAVNGGT